MGTIRPEGAMQDASPFSSAHGRAVENPGPASRTFWTRMSKKRASGVCFSWLLLFAQAKRSDSAAAEGRKPEWPGGKDRERPEADETLRQRRFERVKLKIKMDPGFRRDDEQELQAGLC